MPTTLFPPDYPDDPEAPLRSFGKSFSEEISREVLQGTYRENLDQPYETSLRAAGALTMLEGFHPRDHLECMLATQGVAAHMRIMDLHRYASQPDLPLKDMLRTCGAITQMSRTFTMALRNIERLQGKELPQRPRPARKPPSSGPDTSGPDRAPPSPAGPPAPPPAPPLAEPSAPPLAEPSAPPLAEPSAPPPAGAKPRYMLSEPTDIDVRPDGTPGSFEHYAARPPKRPFIPKEHPLNRALARRPKEYYIVNAPRDPSSGQPGKLPDTVPRPAVPGAQDPARGPVDLQEDMFRGDALARFASRRLDPSAPDEPPDLNENLDAAVELELISTGGDAEGEALRRALMEEHPDGKPIAVFRYGPTSRPEET